MPREYITGIRDDEASFEVLLDRTEASQRAHSTKGDEAARSPQRAQSAGINRLISAFIMSIMALEVRKNAYILSDTKKRIFLSIFFRIFLFLSYINIK